MESKQAQQAQELLALVQDLDAVELQVVAAFLLALRAGQGERAAFAAANEVQERANRQPLSWEAYQSFP